MAEPDVRSEIEQIDERIYWRNGNPKSLEDIACGEGCCPDQEEVLKAYYEKQRKDTIAECIGCLPDKVQPREDPFTDGWNQAISTAKEKMGEL